MKKSNIIFLPLCKHTSRVVTFLMLIVANSVFLFAGERDDELNLDFRQGALNIVHEKSETLADSESNETGEREKSFVKFIKEDLNLESSLLLSSEYDDNAYKTFDTDSADKERDALFRIFFNSDGDYYFSKRDSIDFKYQLGAKKYMQEDSQDTIINYLETSFNHFILDNHKIGIGGNVKLKNEKEGDESFILTSANFDYQYRYRPIFFKINFDALYTYFDFFDNSAFSFHRGRYGLLISKSLFADYIFGTIGYHLENQHFVDRLTGYDDKRKDLKHEGALYLDLQKFVLLRGGFVYQDSNSNLDELSFTSYKVIFQLSKIFYERLTIMFLTVLLSKNYPSVSDVTEEGERFILTSQEEENFNSIISKISWEMRRDLFLEFKYSRFSNELSNEEDPFNRNLFNMGLRIAF